MSAGYVSRTYATDTVITDLDLAFGTAGLNFNQEAAQGIAEALASARARRPDAARPPVDQVRRQAEPPCHARASIDRDFHIECMPSRPILDVVRHNVPCVIVDVPNMWAPWIKYTLLHADEVVITATPDLRSLRNAKNIIDLLRQAPAQRPCRRAS